MQHSPDAIDTFEGSLGAKLLRRDGVHLGQRKGVRGGTGLADETGIIEPLAAHPFVQRLEADEETAMGDAWTWRAARPHEIAAAGEHRDVRVLFTVHESWKERERE